MPVAVPDVRSLPRSDCARLLGEILARLFEPEPVAEPEEPEPMVDITEAARRLGIPFNTLRKHLHEPKFRKLWTYVGTKPMFKPALIRAFLREPS